MRIIAASNYEKGISFFAVSVTNTNEFMNECVLIQFASLQQDLCKFMLKITI